MVQKKMFYLILDLNGWPLLALKPSTLIRRCRPKEDTYERTDLDEQSGLLHDHVIIRKIFDVS